MLDNLPVVFRFGSLVVHGNGFAAEVRAEGHAVAARDPHGVHLSSVAASGLIGTGEDVHEAFEDLRVRLSSALYAVAASAADFDAFVASARALFHGRDEEAARRFEEAVASIAHGIGVASDPAPSAEALHVIRLDRPETPLVAMPTPADALVMLDRRSLLHESVAVAHERRSA